MLSLNSPFLSQLPLRHHHRRHLPAAAASVPLPVVTASLEPPPPKLILLRSSSPALTRNPPESLYQPFRPPPSPLPAELAALDTASQLNVLSNRLGLWHSYAPLIASLLRDGSFTPSSLEEITGISGHEQNRLIVADQVRNSIIESGASPELVAAFDSVSSAALLYEIRLLSAVQRLAAAEYTVGNGLDGKGAADVARAIKDFPKRKTERGFRSFDYNSPGDCLAFMMIRLGREHEEGSEQRAAAFARALAAVVTDDARKAVEEEIAGKGEEGDGDELDGGVRVPVVRLRIGEVAEATSVVILPVCGGDVGELAEAPRDVRGSGEFGVVTAEKLWRRWVVLPRWEPMTAIIGGGVALEFKDARILPWKVNRWSKEEGILVLLDRDRKHVELDDGFYLVAASDNEESELKVERGWKLKEEGVEESLGSVVLVVRPPKDEVEDQLSDEDWE
ncbi:hypothetical protein MLD38_038698 [Melastoma candidum]|uniref:Uncharacterized protein n=1 Tax=Melastoma candidum TaxID=119954 RepID=A0ACB9L026_9MYRT|nr:hypothetical protein MLD38_038698 [Melastoma candidum]